MLNYFSSDKAYYLNLNYRMVDFKYMSLKDMF